MMLTDDRTFMGAMADAIGEKPTREGLIAMLREYAE